MSGIVRSVPEAVIRKRRWKKTLGFRLRHHHCFREDESAMRDYLWMHHFFLIGAWGVGKDAVMDELGRLRVSRIPEYRSDRILRPGEIIGKHLIPMFRAEIAGKREKGPLLIEYLAHPGVQGRESVAALDLSLILAALGRFSASIILPEAIPWLDWEPIVFRLWATEDDHVKMLKNRGETPLFNERYGIAQNEIGGWSDNVLLPSTTIPIQNKYGDAGAAAEEILSYMKKINADPSLRS